MNEKVLNSNVKWHERKASQPNFDSFGHVELQKTVDESPGKL